MNEYTLTGDYTLPSLGKVYNKEVNPNVRLRSMTVMEEQKRLNNSDRPYKNLASILDDCLIEKPGISAYDLCLSDFQFLLHRLRVVTYGPNYKLSSRCPNCGFDNEGEINLLDIPVIQYTEDLNRYLEITLPVSKQVVKLKMQTPRMMDDISVESKRMAKRHHSGTATESAFLLSVSTAIDTVDGEVLDAFRKESFVKELQMADANYLLKAINKINDSFGIDTSLNNICDSCGFEYTSPFRTTPEFFRPSVDFEF